MTVPYKIETVAKLQLPITITQNLNILLLQHYNQHYVSKSSFHYNITTFGPSGLHAPAQQSGHYTLSKGRGPTTINYLRGAPPPLGK